MIATARSRKKYGKGRDSGWLIVDGSDETIVRKAEFAFKPKSSRQRHRLVNLLDCVREVYNAGLQHRRDAYAHPSRTSIQVFDQFIELTAVRESRPELFQCGVQPLRSALRRVDGAFSGYFNRCKRGETPGYPRFKSSARFDTINYDEYENWNIDLARAVLYATGVGEIPLTKSAVKQCRRFADRGGTPKTLTLTRANREGTAWRAAIGYTSIRVEHAPPSYTCSDNIVTTGLDRGVIVPVAADTGNLLDMPPEVKAKIEAIRHIIEDTQRERSRKKLYSRSWRQLSKKIKHLHGKAASIRDNWAKHVAKELVSNNDVIGLEDLNLKGMTKSASGTIDNPGTNVAAKTRLNRSLAEVAPGRFASLVAVKAEEAGRRLWHVPAAYTSRQCSNCGLVDSEARITREVYYCAGCGHYAHADVNAACNIRARTLAAEAAWVKAGSPLLKRRKPRLRRRKADYETEPA